jgi:hypothetical protein
MTLYHFKLQHYPVVPTVCAEGEYLTFPFSFLLNNYLHPFSLTPLPFRRSPMERILDSSDHPHHILQCHLTLPSTPDPLHSSPIFTNATRKLRNHKPILKEECKELSAQAKDQVADSQLQRTHCVHLQATTRPS